MSSCQGELPNRRFDVTAVDAAGRVVFDDTVSTLPNGFFEVWLPRDKDLVMTVEKDGLKSVGPISTQDDAITCVTTFRLE
jgi:hypothetical protein